MASEVGVEYLESKPKVALMTAGCTSDEMEKRLTEVRLDDFLQFSCRDSERVAK